MTENPNYSMVGKDAAVIVGKEPQFGVVVRRIRSTKSGPQYDYLEVKVGPLGASSTIKKDDVILLDWQ